MIYHIAMLKRLLPVALLVPVIALALEIQPADFYIDVRFNAPEAAGINLLTREGILQGYGNRRFGPTRLINRAEFLKIAILASPDGYELPAVGEGCFPDVQSQGWFAPYVCAAKAAGIVSGHADPATAQNAWLFRPGDPVHYDAALKMLVLLYRYPIPDVPGLDWAEPYYRAAAQKGTDLPVRITFDTPLTRGMAARLAGAFLAQSQGQLDQFRLAEAGRYGTASSASSSSSISSSASSISSVASSSSLSTKPLFMLPPVSHFLRTGEASDAIASGVLRSTAESAKVAAVQVKVFQESRAIERLEVVLSDGTVIAKLLKRTTTDLPDYKLTYETQIVPEQQYSIPANTDVPVALRAVVRVRDLGGFSEELVQVRTFSVTIRGETTNETKNLGLNGPFPKHQTSFGRITGVGRVSPVSAKLASGTGFLIGSFSFSGSAVNDTTLSLRQLNFSVYRTGTVLVQGWTLQNRETGASTTCSFNEAAMTVTCPNLLLLAAIRRDAPLVMDLKANIFVSPSATDASLEVFLDAAGSPESLGSVEWTDGTGQFRWIEGPSPVARGTRLQ